LYRLEENESLLLTPFEKNIEVWKQLWRVIERSDLVVQILDARDPLLFRSPDLEKYVDEFPDHKLNILLMNKADLLSEPQRNAWASYFKQAGIRVIFFSARAEQLKIEQELKEAQDDVVKKLTKLNPYSGLDESDSDGQDEEEEEDNEEDDGVSEATRQNGIFDQERLKKLLRGEDEEGQDSADADLHLLAALRGSGSRLHPGDKKSNTVKFAADDSASSASTKQHKDEEMTDSKDEPDSDSHQIQHVDTSMDSITGRILSRTELFDYLYSFVRAELGPKEKITVGMVGYPNVGKSSTVNVLVEKKKVAVSSTPGKTKHFQTLQIHDNITLCDCPGLVFPTFMSSKAEMFCNGLLRIAEMRECIAPTSIVTRLIPRREFEYVYGISLPKRIDPTSIVTTGDGKAYAPKAKLSPQQLLDTYSTLRGFFITAGKPDQFKSARIVLNDFVDGKLLFCRAPPSVEQKRYSDWTKYQNPDLRTVGEDAPIRAPNRHADTTKPITPVRSDSVDDDGNETEELSPEDLINLNDPEELRRMTGAPVAHQAKMKHQRINRKQEKRREKKGHANESRMAQGIHMDFKPGISKDQRTLPTNVKLTPGRRAPGADPNSTAAGRTFHASVKK
jgi:large subunit GTPase 1